MELIAQGAEAKLYKDGKQLIKERIPKGYRIKELDETIRKKRTRKESKILEKISKLGFSPKVISDDDRSKITMDFIEGKTLRDCLTEKNYKALMNELGKKIAILHNNDIVHGDLTTSNFICHDQIYFIDFGLSFETHKIEDKAVDLHLLRQALESKYYKIWKGCFDEVLEIYKKDAKEGKEVIARLEVVEKRGRYKH